MLKTKDPYKVDKKYLKDPFKHLYQDNDVPVSEANHIQEILEVAEELNLKIEGDFDLKYLTFQVLDFRFSFVKIGLISAKVKFLRLYKKVSTTFHNFCKEYFHRGADYIDRLIEASAVVMELISQGHHILPQNESQCRSLLNSYRKLKLAPAHTEVQEDLTLSQVWQHVVTEVEPHKITWKTIEENILDLLPIDPDLKEVTQAKVVLPVYLIEAIWEQARQMSLSFVEYLEELIQPRKKSDNLSEKLKQENWELDRERLVEEHEKLENSG